MGTYYSPFNSKTLSNWHFFFNIPQADCLCTLYSKWHCGDLSYLCNFLGDYAAFSVQKMCASGKTSTFILPYLLWIWCFHSSPHWSATGLEGLANLSLQLLPKQYFSKFLLFLHPTQYPCNYWHGLITFSTIALKVICSWAITLILGLMYFCSFYVYRSTETRRKKEDPKILIIICFFFLLSLCT